MLKDAVVVVVKDDFGRVLLAQRSEADSFGGVWNPVTGEVDGGESFEAACRRETREEVGIEVEVGPKIFESTTSGAPFVLHWFEARALSDDFLLQEDEIADVRWVSREELCDVGSMFRETFEFLQRWMKKGEA